MRKKDVFGEASENKSKYLLLVNPTMKKEEINLDLNKVKEGGNENALQALLKELEQCCDQANVAPIDYKSDRVIKSKKRKKDLQIKDT